MAINKIDSDPKTYQAAMSSAEKAAWQRAMDSEMHSIEQAGTWLLVPAPPGRAIVGCKWVWKAKRGADGQIIKHKARLVAKGFTQRYGVDYDETYAPVARYGSVRAIIALAAHHGYELHQMDVRSAFLNGELEEDIYMQQPVRQVLVVVAPVHARAARYARRLRRLAALRSRDGAVRQRLRRPLLPRLPHLLHGGAAARLVESAQPRPVVRPRLHAAHRAFRRREGLRTRMGPLGCSVCIGQIQAQDAALWRPAGPAVEGAARLLLLLLLFLRLLQDPQGRHSLLERTGARTDNSQCGMQCRARNAVQSAGGHDQSWPVCASMAVTIKCMCSCSLSSCFCLSPLLTLY